MENLIEVIKAKMEIIPHWIQNIIEPINESFNNNYKGSLNSI
jgi:hypothetical protein